MIKQNNEFNTSINDVKPEWHIIDASDQSLGRVSSEIATILQGKHKVLYVPYINTGDYVVVINAEKIKITGKKLEQKTYYRHSGYPGGIKQKSLAKVMNESPIEAIKHSVKGMLPKNSVGRKMLSKLKVYVGDKHKHHAQFKTGESLATPITKED